MTRCRWQAKVELEQLRMERDTARESAATANAEAARLSADAKRVSAVAQREAAELCRELAIAKARVERLEADLEEVVLQVEVNAAKAAMYDEAHDQVERLRAQLASAAGKGAGESAELQLLREERQQLQHALTDKAHATQMLAQDKAYLTKECQGACERIEKLEAEAQNCATKTRHLKLANTALQDKLLATTDDSRLAYEMRLQAEVTRAHEQASANVEK